MNPFPHQHISLSGHCDGNHTHQAFPCFPGTVHKNVQSKIYPRKKRQKKNSILDIKGTNEKCFLFCVAAGLMHNDFEEKASKENPKNYENFIDKEFDISGIDFPIKISQIEQFVKQNNRHRLSINIYTVFDGQVKTVKSNITHENNENPNVIDLLAVFIFLWYLTNVT